MEVVRGLSNRRNEGNSVRGTIIIITTVITYFISDILIQWPIYVSRRQVMHYDIKTKVRATSSTLMCDTYVKNQGNRSHRVSQVGGKLDVSTSLTPGSLSTVEFLLTGLRKQKRILFCMVLIHTCSIFF